MRSTMAARIRELRAMTVNELRAKYREVFGEETTARNKDVLWKRVAWRMQALEEGDLTERARRRAAELANEADLRIRAPAGAFDAGLPSHSRTTRHAVSHPLDPRLPMPGTVLTREFNGRVHRATVLAEGFKWQGRSFRSLSTGASSSHGHAHLGNRSRML